ncbi:hypothetical protein ACWD8I_20460, partial [Micromonospora arida]
MSSEQHQTAPAVRGSRGRWRRWRRARPFGAAVLTTQTAKLLTLLVEFNDKANDDFTGVMVP